MLEQVLEKNPDTVKVAFKNFPIGSHKFAVKAAIAALAADSEGKFWEFHDALFQNYNRLTDQKIDEIAVAVGLDPPKFNAKVKDPELAQRVRKDAMEGRLVGVKGTPTIFINGRRLTDRSPQGFQAAVDRALQKGVK